ncbi:MAG: hypothetical protein V1754_05580, partial [Pseudomonadota bacterium]
MDFRIVEKVGHPLKDVYLTYRDHLSELAPYLPNVDKIEAVEREESEGQVKLVNRWHVSAAVPRVLRPFFRTEQLSYLDHAVWKDELW